MGSKIHTKNERRTWSILPVPVLNSVIWSVKTLPSIASISPISNVWFVQIPVLLRYALGRYFLESSVICLPRTVAKLQSNIATSSIFSDNKYIQRMAGHTQCRSSSIVRTIFPRNPKAKHHQHRENKNDLTTTVSKNLGQRTFTCVCVWARLVLDGNDILTQTCCVSFKSSVSYELLARERYSYPAT